MLTAAKLASIFPPPHIIFILADYQLPSLQYVLWTWKNFAIVYVFNSKNLQLLILALFWLLCMCNKNECDQAFKGPNRYLYKGFLLDVVLVLSWVYIQISAAKTLMLLKSFCSRKNTTVGEGDIYVKKKYSSPQSHYNSNIWSAWLSPKLWFPNYLDYNFFNP